MFDFSGAQFHPAVVKSSVFPENCWVLIFLGQSGAKKNCLSSEHKSWSLIASFEGGKIVLNRPLSSTEPSFYLFFVLVFSTVGGATTNSQSEQMQNDNSPIHGRRPILTYDKDSQCPKSLRDTIVLVISKPCTFIVIIVISFSKSPLESFYLVIASFFAWDHSKARFSKPLQGCVHLVD